MNEDDYDAGWASRVLISHGIAGPVLDRVCANYRVIIQHDPVKGREFPNEAKISHMTSASFDKSA